MKTFGKCLSIRLLEEDYRVCQILFILKKGNSSNLEVYIHLRKMQKIYFLGQSLCCHRMNRLIFDDVTLSQIFKQHDQMLALCLLVFIKGRQSSYN